MAGTLGSNLYENKWRIDLAFRDSTKAKALRNAALDGLSSAMFTGVIKGAKIEGFKNLSAGQKVTRLAQHEAIKAGISTSIGRGDLKSNLRRAGGNTLMQSASLGVTSTLQDASGFQRGITNTVVQSAVAGAIGRDVASTAIGTAVSSTMAEANVKIGSKLELQDFSSATSAAVVLATGGDVEQIADAVSAAESVKFTRGLVKDDIREAIARGEASSDALGVAAGDAPEKTGSLAEEVREELEIERVVIHAKALERRAKESQKAKVELEEFKKEELRIQLRKEAEYNEQIATQLEGDPQKYAIAKAKVLREMDIRLGQAKIIGQEKLVSMMLSLGSKEANIGAVDAYGRMIDYISFKSGEITDKKMPWLKSEVGAITRVAASNVADFAKEHFPGAAGALANAATKVHEAKTLAYDAGKLSFGERIVADLIIDAAMIEVGAGAVKFTGQVGASAVEGVRAARVTTTQSAKSSAPVVKASAINKNAIEWTSPTGTKQTYKIYQRNDINWDMVRTDGDKKFIGKTNREASINAGLPAQLEDGSFATLHHINQDGKGKLVEASTRYHGVGKPGQDALHSIWGKNKPHPTNPIDRPKFGQDSKAYWKWRASNE